MLLLQDGRDVLEPSRVDDKACCGVFDGLFGVDDVSVSPLRHMIAKCRTFRVVYYWSHSRVECHDGRRNHLLLGNECFTGNLTNPSSDASTSVKHHRQSTTFIHQSSLKITPTFYIRAEERKSGVCVYRICRKLQKDPWFRSGTTEWTKKVSCCMGGLYLRQLWTSLKTFHR